MSILEKRLHKSRYRRMLYWFLERYAIHRARLQGLSPPWTHDPVLRQNFFTNPYREHDRVTSWFRENIRYPMCLDPGVIFATVAFRWFNWPPTGALLLKENLFKHWDYDTACNLLQEAARRKEKLFSSAYIIKVENGISKHISVCRQLGKWWKMKDEHIDKIMNNNTLEGVHRYVMRNRHLGGFMSYEIVSDLRWTFLLEDAKDIDTWCFTGPGCIRGLLRLRGEPSSKILRSSVGNRSSLAGGLDDCRYLHSRLRGDLEAVMDGTLKILIPGTRRVYIPPYVSLPPIEMREIEHTLCEFDKYERVFNGEGKSKRNFEPTSADVNNLQTPTYLQDEEMKSHYGIT